jgi:hypothetical protein
MNELSFITSRELNRDHHLEQFVVMLLLSQECVFGKPLPSKWTYASVRCYSGFQAVFTEPLPNNGHIHHNIKMDAREIGWGGMH